MALPLRAGYSLAKLVSTNPSGASSICHPAIVVDVVSERIIFEVGATRFAINWTAEIEKLPPAGPVVVERKQRLKSHRSSPVRC